METNNQITRRKFIRNTAFSTAALPLVGGLSSGIARPSKAPAQLDIHIFSKHLQFLDHKDMAEAAAEIGFDGVDLTVRPKGHVLPDQVEDSLPKAVEHIRKNGLKADMMTTSINDPDQEIAKKVLTTAAGNGIKTYRMGYWRFKKDEDIPAALSQLRKKMQKLAVLNKKLGITGGYQNHSGSFVGASLWEVWQLLENTDKAGVGSQYDIRHATLEGGYYWKTSLRLLRERIVSVVLKDFKWQKIDGKWKAINTPIGEGMVDFAAFFQLLKQYKIHVPISLHYEYLGGMTDRNEIFQTMKKDLEKVRELWSNT